MDLPFLLKFPHCFRCEHPYVFVYSDIVMADIVWLLLVFDVNLCWLMYP